MVEVRKFYSASFWTNLLHIYLYRATGYIHTETILMTHPMFQKFCLLGRIYILDTLSYVQVVWFFYATQNIFGSGPIIINWIEPT